MASIPLVAKVEFQQPAHGTGRLASMKKSFCVAPFALALVACSSSHHDSAPEAYVRFESPEDHAVLSGLADVRVDISLPEPVSTYEVGVEGQPLTHFKDISPTLQLNTTNIENGDRTLVIKATGESGQQWSDTVDVEIKNASHQLLSYETNAQTYAKGEKVVLDLTYPTPNLSVTADFTNLDDHYNKGDVSVAERGNGKYQLTYTISADDGVASGEHRITVSATNAARETVTTPIDLKLREHPQLPLSMPGATFVDDDAAPVMSGVPSAPAIQAVTGDKQLFSGKPASVNVAWTQTGDTVADRIVVRSPDYSGYLVLPVDGVTAQSAALPLQLASKPTPNMSKKTLDLLLAAIDSTGATGAWTPVTLTQFISQPFGTLVTLWWDNPVDIDLQVQTPQGHTIRYENPTIDGGKLELDSNSACALDYINTERVTWPIGAAAAGTYTVVAKLYDACGQSGATFHALISACGKVQEVDGTFAAADMNTSNATKTIATFDVNCMRRTHGRVKFAQPKALKDNFVMPAAFVPVRAVSSTSGTWTVWAQSTTDEQGQFDFYLPDTTPTDYSIEVEASWTPPGQPTPQAQVVGLTGNQVYRMQIAADPNAQNSDAGQDVLIDVASSSGALSILDTLRHGYSWVSGHFNAADARKVKAIKARWTAAKDTPAPHSSYYSSGDAIYVGGSANDGDEFDSPVLSHEFMHHVTNCVMGAGPGGDHWFEKRTNPPLAWNEGIATAFGQQSLGSPLYWDVNGGWSSFVNLESSWVDLETPLADKGTTGNKMSGNVGEVLVAMVLWDLLDPVGDNVTEFDTIEPTYAQTLNSVTNYMPQPSRANRGYWGLDLVDFLDGWRCQWQTLMQRDLDLALTLNDRDFPYDFSLKLKCK